MFFIERTNLFIIIFCLYFCNESNSLKNYKNHKSYNSDLITFPRDNQFSRVKDENLDSLLIKSSNIRNVDDMLRIFGASLTDDTGILTRRKTNFAEQATCEPEMRTIDLDSSDDKSAIYFPKCIRLPRCGGCCGPSHLLDCVPTKISYKKIKRARIRVKRSSNGRASSEASQLEENVEVHDQCKCQCKVQEKHCDLSIHRYRPDLCKCQCLNENDEVECHKQGAYKIWDSQNCECKCRNVKLCSTGLSFRHSTCRCEPL